MTRLKVCLWIIGLFPLLSYAQSIGDYQSRKSGNWDTNNMWQVYTAGGWVNTNTPPSSTDGQISILTGHTVTANINLTVDQVYVALAATLVVNANITLSKGPAPIMLQVTLAGIVRNAGVIQGDATSNFFEAGAVYEHNFSGLANGGSVPYATWDIDSTIKVVGFSGNLDYSLNSASWSQEFGNFEYASTQNNNRIVNFQGLLTKVRGEFRISNFGGNGSIVSLSGDQNFTLDVGGDFIITNLVPYTGIGARRIYLKSALAGSAVVNVTGNFLYQGGLLDVGVNNATATINLMGTSVQTYTRTPTFPNTVANGKKIHLNIVAGATVDFGATSSFNGLGDFTLAGTMRTGAATGLNGSLTNVGAKTFNSNCAITYNGVVAQVMGGLYPGAPASGINVVINNAAGVTTSALTSPATLVTSITGNLTLQTGTLTVAGVHTLQLDGTASSTAGNIFMSAGSNLVINGTGPLGVDPFPFSADQTFNNFSLNRSGTTVTLANNMILNGIATLAEGTLAIPSVQVTLNGNIVVANGLVSGNTTSDLFIDGAGTIDVINFSPAGNTLGILNINRSGTSVQFGGDYTIANMLNVTAGTLEGDASLITMQGTTWTVDGGSGGLFNPGTSTVIFDGTTAVTLGTDFHNIQLNATRSLDFPVDNINISGNIDFATGSIFSPSVGTVVLNGNADQLINSNGTEFYTIQVNKGGGEVNTGSPLAIQHLLDIQSVTDVNSNGNLTLLSLGFTTDQDASIGPVPSGAAVNGNVTTQRYMDPVGNTFRYLASPVSGALPPALWGSTIYSYQYNGGTGSYVKHTTSSQLGVGTGYVIGRNMSSPITWSVSGPITTGSYTWNFPQEGWHLVGNPFPSAIRWYDSPGVAWDVTNVSTTIAVTDNAVAGYPNYFRYWSYDPVNNPGDWGTGPLANGMVAMGQAFWVYAGTGGGSLTIYEQAKESSFIGEFYRTQPSEKPNMLTVSLDNGKSADVAYLKLNPHATVDYEFRYDLKKLKNQEMNVSLKDPGNQELVISTMDKLEGGMRIPVAIEVRDLGEFTLSFGFVDSFTYGNSLYLVDTYERKSVPVSTGKYAFTVNESSKSYENRFYLSLDPVIFEKNLADRVDTYPNPVKDRLNIRVADDEMVSMNLMDHQGKELWSAEVRGSSEIDMSDYPQGMYVLRIATKEGRVLRKIIR